MAFLNKGKKIMKYMKIKKSEKSFHEDSWNPDSQKIKKAFDFYLKDLKPLVAKTGLQQPSGMHGLDTHTNAVVFRGIDYALHMRQDPIPVVFACAFHDMARTDDENDNEHGKKAVPMAIKIMKLFPCLSDKNIRFSILYAILNHTNGETARDYISACLWDADRTRMAWHYGFDEKFFNTARGKYVAQHWKKYLEFQRFCFPKINWSKQY